MGMLRKKCPNPTYARNSCRPFIVRVVWMVVTTVTVMVIEEYIQAIQYQSKNIQSRT